MRSAALVPDEVADSGVMSQIRRSRRSPPLASRRRYVTPPDQFGQAVGAGLADEADNARDRTAVLGDHEFCAVPDPREIAAEVVLQLAHSHRLYCRWVAKGRGSGPRPRAASCPRPTPPARGSRWRLSRAQ